MNCLRNIIAIQENDLWSGFLLKDPGLERTRAGLHFLLPCVGVLSGKLFDEDKENYVCSVICTLCAGLHHTDKGGHLYT